MKNFRGQKYAYIYCLNTKIRLTILIQVVLTYILLGCPCCFKNGDLLSVLASRPHVNGVFGHQKCRFLKTVPKMEFFQKTAGLSFPRGRTKTEVFECDGVIHAIVFPLLQCFCVKKGERFEYAICLAKTQKISVLKNTCGRGLNMSPVAKDLPLFCATFLPVLFLLPLLHFF